MLVELESETVNNMMFYGTILIALFSTYCFFMINKFASHFLSMWKLERWFCFYDENSNTINTAISSIFDAIVSFEKRSQRSGLFNKIIGCIASSTIGACTMCCPGLRSKCGTVKRPHKVQKDISSRYLRREKPRKYRLCPYAKKGINRSQCSPAMIESFRSEILPQRTEPVSFGCSACPLNSSFPNNTPTTPTTSILDAVSGIANVLGIYDQFANMFCKNSQATQQATQQVTQRATQQSTPATDFINNFCRQVGFSNFNSNNNCVKTAPNQSNTAINPFSFSIPSKPNRKIPPPPPKKTVKYVDGVSPETDGIRVYPTLDFYSNNIIPSQKTYTNSLFSSPSPIPQPEESTSTTKSQCDDLINELLSCSDTESLPDVADATYPELPIESLNSDGESDFDLRNEPYYNELE